VQVTIGDSGKFTVQLAAGTYAAVLARQLWCQRVRT
jgi:hypothetical protein